MVEFINIKMEQTKQKIGKMVFQDVLIFQKSLMEMRYKLKPNENQLKVQQSLQHILLQISSIHEQMHNILSYFCESPATNQIVKSKLPMYYFQVLNLSLINLGPQHQFSSLEPISIFKNFNIFSQIQAKISTSQSSKAFKAFLIFYFNLLKRISQSFVTREEIDHIFSILQNVLSCYFESHSDKKLEKQAKFKEETQWMGFIFQFLPTIQWNSINEEFSESFLKNYFAFVDKNESNESQKRKSKYKILHMIGNFLHLVIQRRTTTELIKGYECPIQDVKQMYSKPNKDKLCNIKLNKQDIEFFSQLLIETYVQQKELFREIFKNKQESIKKAYEVPEEYLLNAEDNEVDQFDQKVKQSQVGHHEITLGDLLIEIINLLNSVLFLGGYSPKIQTLIYKKLFENHILPQFLELVYLIYNQRRLMGKYSIKVTMAKPPDANLSKLLDIDYESITKQERQVIFKLIGQEIKYGQLSVLLRLMTNLIHINNEALGYFENNVKYVHMIMSLTHDSEMNLTMKNWAVLFIKNCCDSQALRDEIGKIKIQMKVQD